MPTYDPNAETHLQGSCLLKDTSSAGASGTEISIAFVQRMGPAI
jgi:hypothetical protein